MCQTSCSRATPVAEDGNPPVDITFDCQKPKQRHTPAKEARRQLLSEMLYL